MVKFMTVESWTCPVKNLQRDFFERARARVGFAEAAFRVFIHAL
jgi:hypothetical protein